MKRTVLTSAMIALLPASLLAGPYDPPAGEYTSVESAIASSTPATLAASLRAALSTRINTGVSQISYQNGRFRYDESDLDLDTPGNIITIYSGRSISGVWDSGATWNREHTWPSSHMVNNSSGSLEYTDFHQLRPCISSVNSSRGNKPFGDDSSALWDPGFDSRGGLNYTFDPQDRGEMARTMFYFTTRFGHTLVNVTNDNQLANGQMGRLDDLLRWHFEHPVDVREQFRNDYVDDSIQFNRNPFVDRNEYVWAIWGDQANDTTLTLDGETPSNGATATTVDLGDVITGTPFPTQSVAFTKTGATPTTYSIRTTGDAINDLTDVTLMPARTISGGFRMDVTTDDWMGRNLSFGYGPTAHNGAVTGITLLEKGVAGDVSGTIILDNTDLTSAGPGTGNDDGDDVITVIGRELDRSEASFSSVADVDSAMFDFGVIPAGDTTPVEVRITNLDAPSGMTVELRVTSVMGTGDTGAFDLGNIPTLAGLNGGNTSVNFVTVAETMPGTYSATYTIEVADDPIPGASAGTPLTLTLMATVEEVLVLCQADVNGDGVVDIIDFGVFGTAFGSMLGDPNYNPAVDFNNDDMIDIIDFGVFGMEFGATNCAV